MAAICVSSAVRSRISFCARSGVVPEVRVLGARVQLGEAALGADPSQRCLLSRPIDCLMSSTSVLDFGAHDAGCIQSGDGGRASIGNGAGL